MSRIKKGRIRHPAGTEMESSSTADLCFILYTRHAKSHLVGDGEEVPLLVAQLDARLRDGFHTGGHVIVPATQQTFSSEKQTSLFFKG